MEQKKMRMRMKWGDCVIINCLHGTHLKVAHLLSDRNLYHLGRYVGYWYLLMAGIEWDRVSHSSIWDNVASSTIIPKHLQQQHVCFVLRLGGEIQLQNN